MDDDTKCNELKRLPSFESVFGLRVTAAKSKQGFAQDCWSSTKTTLEKTHEKKSMDRTGKWYGVSSLSVSLYLQF
jgi:hypothetical protein